MGRKIEDVIEELVSELMAGGRRALTLEEIGEKIGHRAFGSAEVEMLFARLEQEGATIGAEEGEGLVLLLQRVIATATELRREGAGPSPTAISERSGLSVRAVRVALLYADVLKG